MCVAQHAQISSPPVFYPPVSHTRRSTRFQDTAWTPLFWRSCHIFTLNTTTLNTTTLNTTTLNTTNLLQYDHPVTMQGSNGFDCNNFNMDFDGTSFDINNADYSCSGPMSFSGSGSNFTADNRSSFSGTQLDYEMGYIPDDVYKLNYNAYSMPYPTTYTDFGNGEPFRQFCGQTSGATAFGGTFELQASNQQTPFQPLGYLQPTFMPTQPLSYSPPASPPNQQPAFPQLQPQLEEQQPQQWSKQSKPRAKPTREDGTRCKVDLRKWHKNVVGFEWRCSRSISYETNDARPTKFKTTSNCEQVPIASVGTKRAREEDGKPADNVSYGTAQPATKKQRRFQPHSSLAGHAAAAVTAARTTLVQQHLIETDTILAAQPEIQHHGDFLDAFYAAVSNKASSQDSSTLSDVPGALFDQMLAEYETSGTNLATTLEISQQQSTDYTVLDVQLPYRSTTPGVSQQISDEDFAIASRTEDESFVLMMGEYYPGNTIEWPLEITDDVQPTYIDLTSDDNGEQAASQPMEPSAYQSNEARSDSTIRTPTERIHLSDEENAVLSASLKAGMHSRLNKKMATWKIDATWRTWQQQISERKQRKKEQAKRDAEEKAANEKAAAEKEAKKAVEKQRKEEAARKRKNEKQREQRAAKKAQEGRKDALPSSELVIGDSTSESQSVTTPYYEVTSEDEAAFLEGLIGEDTEGLVGEDTEGYLLPADEDVVFSDFIIEDSATPPPPPTQPAGRKLSREAFGHRPLPEENPDESDNDSLFGDGKASGAEENADEANDDDNDSLFGDGKASDAEEDAGESEDDDTLFGGDDEPVFDTNAHIDDKTVTPPTSIDPAVDEESEVSEEE